MLRLLILAHYIFAGWISLFLGIDVTCIIVKFILRKVYRAQVLPEDGSVHIFTRLHGSVCTGDVWSFIVYGYIGISWSALVTLQQF